MEDLFEAIGNLYTKQRELAAIWLTRSLQKKGERSARIATGDEIKILNGELVDLPNDEEPTHRILKTYGTLVNQFEILVEDLKTNNQSRIKL